MTDTPPPPPPFLPPPSAPGGGIPPAPAGPPSYGGTPFGGAPGDPAPYGGTPQFPYGAMPGAPPSRSGKALAALILGLASVLLFITIVVPLLALIFGLLGAKEVKRSGGTRTGLGKARAGWILGLLGLLGGAATWIAVASEVSGTKSVTELEVGDCVDLPDGDDDEVSRLDSLDCTELHDAEVVSVGDLGDGDDPYPGVSEVREAMVEPCLEDFEDYVGIDYEASELLIFQLYPTENNWENDQGYVCLAYLDNDVQLEETVRDFGALMAGVDRQVLQAQLDQWAAAHYHEGVTVRDLRPMPGHAGLSFGFDVADSTGLLDRLVIRMPPKGVRRAGNTDVLRQVPLLRALAAQGVPVAPVVWFDDDERWFEVPYLMVRFLRGDTYQVREPVPSFTGIPCADVLRAAVQGLASVHLVAHRAVLPNWEHPKDLCAEIEFWAPILQKAAEPEWIEMGERTRELLLQRLPADPTVGIFHGDFQTNNVLFDGTRVVAILDWEISGIGAQLLDLGWLLFMNDADSWADGDGLGAVPAFADIVGWYAAATRRAVTLDDVAFYRALSGYRFGVISGLNVMLHRTGKRHDPEWEGIARSVPSMFGRACDLLA